MGEMVFVQLDQCRGRRSCRLISVTENKSIPITPPHFNVRVVRLEWRSRVDYVRTVIKQAHRIAFKTLADSILRSTVTGLPVEFWADDTVFEVWNLLVGERMKGGKSTYTLTWVWNRPADGNGDHFCN
jgi:hypothetical protein